MSCSGMRLNKPQDLTWHAIKDGTRVRTKIAATTGLSAKRVQQAVYDLEAAGLIEVRASDRRIFLPGEQPQMQSSVELTGWRSF